MIMHTIVFCGFSIPTLAFSMVWCMKDNDKCGDIK